MSMTPKRLLCKELQKIFPFMGQEDINNVSNPIDFYPTNKMSITFKEIEMLSNMFGTKNISLVFGTFNVRIRVEASFSIFAEKSG